MCPKQKKILEEFIVKNLCVYSAYIRDKETEQMQLRL